MKLRGRANIYIVKMKLQKPTPSALSIIFSLTDMTWKKRADMV